jgi:hypothetical protein
MSVSRLSRPVRTLLIVMTALTVAVLAVAAWLYLRTEPVPNSAVEIALPEFEVGDEFRSEQTRAVAGISGAPAQRPEAMPRAEITDQACLEGVVTPIRGLIARHPSGAAWEASEELNPWLGSLGVHCSPDDEQAFRRIELDPWLNYRIEPPTGETVVIYLDELVEADED